MTLCERRLTMRSSEPAPHLHHDNRIFPWPFVLRRFNLNRWRRSMGCGRAFVWADVDCRRFYCPIRRVFTYRVLQVLHSQEIRNPTTYVFNGLISATIHRPAPSSRTTAISETTRPDRTPKPAFN